MRQSWHYHYKLRFMCQSYESMLSIAVSSALVRSTGTLIVREGSDECQSRKALATDLHFLSTILHIYFSQDLSDQCPIIAQTVGDSNQGCLPHERWSLPSGSDNLEIHSNEHEDYLGGKEHRRLEAEMQC